MQATTAFAAVAFLLIGAAVGYLGRRYWAAKQFGTVEEKIKKDLAEAEAKAKEIVVEAKDKAASLLVEQKNEDKERRKEIDALEAHLLRKEETLDKKAADVDTESARVRAQDEKLKVKEAELAGREGEIGARLEKIGGLSVAQARDEIVRQAKEDRAQDLAQLIQKIDRENRDEVEKRSAEIITTALQRYARSHVAEITTTLFPLADDDLKGKIIGREGRNIRALERATGVEFIIDEAPEAIIISSFDPFRREVARMALEKLVKDGRIQPAKIEEKVEEAKTELAKRTLEIGEAAAQDLGVFGLPKELLQLLGRLHFRTSFGQNVLIHSTEMAYIAEMMARELGLNAEVAKKGALLHDIGKAIDHEVEGTHVELGIKILKKYNVDEAVIEAMQSHHEDYPYARPEAYIVTAADILSAARPGARRGTLENYIKRLGDLEKIANEFPGVKSAYAIAAGRELRVFVVPEKIDDFRALELAREIANRIQSELKYPGEIKVNVIREMRAVEYAR
ncbi:MAG TPA: ribonuclease Y [Candidatus Paceibacterota bacterium]|nr:ribonuclease Y [Candidatus Paceibacterota bacterium]